jgi:hypothetical protein
MATSFQVAGSAKLRLAHRIALMGTDMKKRPANLFFLFFIRVHPCNPWSTFFANEGHGNKPMLLIQFSSRRRY